MYQKLTIEQCENGFILASEYEVEDGKFETVKELVIGEDDEREGMTKLLIKVANQFIHFNYLTTFYRNAIISVYGKSISLSSLPK